MQRISSLESIFFSCFVIGPVAHCVSPSPVRRTLPQLIPRIPAMHSPIPNVGQGTDLHLLSAVNQPLLHRRDAFLLFHALFDPRDLVVRLDVELDFAAGESTDPA
jgi:hypothetical protein